MKPLPPNRRRGPAWAPWIATAVVLALMLALLAGLALREDYSLDEGYTVRRVETSWRQLYAPTLIAPVEPAGPFDLKDVYDLNPPLYFTLIRLLTGLHPGKFTVCLFSMLPMVLGLALLCDWARRQLGARAALAIALTGATAPLLIYYGHEARPYAFGFMLASLLIWLAARLRQRPKLLLAASLAIAAAGSLTHFAFSWFVIAFWALQGMAWLQARRDGNAPERRAAGAMLGGLAAGSLIAVLVILPQISILWICKYASSQVITPEVLMMTTGLPYCWAGSQPIAPWAGFALQGALIGVLWLTARKSPRSLQGMLGLALWLITMALPVIVYYWFGVAYYTRYTIFALTGWLMMVGWLAEETRWLAGWRKAAVALVFLAMLGVSTAWAARNLGRPLRQHWRPIIETLRSQGRPGDAYGFAPYFMRVVFAANARTPLPMKYHDSRYGLPPGVDRYWVVLDATLNKGPQGSPDPAQWRMEHVQSSYQLELYRLERVKPAK